MGFAGFSSPRFLRTEPVLPPSNWVAMPPSGTRQTDSSALYSPLAGNRKLSYSLAVPVNTVSPEAVRMVRVV